MCCEYMAMLVPDRAAVSEFSNQTITFESNGDNQFKLRLPWAILLHFLQLYRVHYTQKFQFYQRLTVKNGPLDYSLVCIIYMSSVVDFTAVHMIGDGIVTSVCKTLQVIR